VKLPERIERKIVRVPFSGCWLWVGSASRYGYVWDGAQVATAHRTVFRMAGGVIPDDKELLHTCDIGVCVNPSHLVVGTHSENMADMARKGRGKAPTGDAHWTRGDRSRARAIGRANIINSHGRGELNNNAKVTQQLAEQMRATYAAQPTLTMTALGQQFGLGREQTRKIIKGIAWKS
jgi:hypothetical protein